VRENVGIHLVDVRGGYGVVVAVYVTTIVVDLGDMVVGDASYLDLGIIVARPCSWVGVLAYRGIPFVLVWLHGRDLDVLRIHHSVVVEVVVVGQNHTDRVRRQDTLVHQDNPVGTVRL
jgi:ABC-type uncharacterized transport system permease subunit